MNQLKILFVEDTPNDVELVLRALLKGGVQVQYHAQVDSASDLRNELKKQDWDLVISDYNLPGFNGMEALKIVQSVSPTVPFIIVSGAIGEELAVDLLRNGAKDFISKSNFSRLVPAIHRELAEVQRLLKMQRIENRLQETEFNLKLMIDSVKDYAIFIVDPERKIASWNRGAERLFGYNENEAKGLSVDFLYLPEEREQAIPQREIESAIQSKNYQTESWKLRKDGSQFWASGSLASLYDQNQQIRGFAFIMKDQTEQKRAQQQIEEEKAKAESANRAKSQFLANMSHEIRTPLGVMIGFAEMLTDEEASAGNHLNYAKRILKNGRQLSRIIDDILDVSKVEANKLDIELCEINLNEFISDVVSILELKAQEKGLVLEAVYDSSAPQKIEADSTRLRQILLNIIGNAIKFTDKGFVRIRVSSQEMVKNLSSIQVRIQIEDSGKGIPTEAAKKLFAPFSQGDISVNRRFGGTGLGLYLSKQLCQALGGDLRLVSSEENRGSTFEITFVSRRIETFAKKSSFSLSKTSTAKQSANRLPLENVRILVIDDSIDNCELFSSFLNRVGAEIVCCQDGFSGIEKALTGEFDLILLDIQMPRLDGYEVMSRLQDAGYSKPVLALTAHAFDSEKQKCLQMGFSDHLKKPISVPDLIESCRIHFEKTQSSQNPLVHHNKPESQQSPLN